MVLRHQRWKKKSAGQGPGRRRCSKKGSWEKTEKTSRRQNGPVKDSKTSLSQQKKMETRRNAGSVGISHTRKRTVSGRCAQMHTLTRTFSAFLHSDRSFDASRAGKLFAKRYNPFSSCILDQHRFFLRILLLEKLSQRLLAASVVVVLSPVLSLT